MKVPCTLNLICTFLLILAICLKLSFHSAQKQMTFFFIFKTCLSRQTNNKHCECTSAVKIENKPVDHESMFNEWQPSICLMCIFV